MANSAVQRKKKHRPYNTIVKYLKLTNHNKYVFSLKQKKKTTTIRIAGGVFSKRTHPKLIK